MSCGQVVAMVFILTIETLLLILIPTIAEINLTVLFVLMALSLLSLILLSLDYFYLLCFDPADPRLIDPNFTEEGEELQFCK